MHKPNRRDASDAGSMACPWGSLTARGHPTHWLIYAQVADHLAERAPRGPRSVGAALFAAGGFDELARQFDLTSDDVEDAVRSRLGPRDAASPPDVGRRRPSRDDSARLTAELAKELDSPVLPAA